MSDSTKPLLLVLTHMLPVENADNAGQNFVTAQVREWLRSYEVRCLAIPGRSASTQMARSIVKTHVIQPAPRSCRSWLLTKLGSRALRSLPGVPNPALLEDLRSDPIARAWLEESSAVVLQWQRESGLARGLRGMTKSSRIIGVLHDVESQGIGRRLQQAPTRVLQVKLRVQRLAARLAERHIMMTNDDVIVLSEKDARLLPSGKAHLHVVPPPVPAPCRPRRAPEANRILFVAGARSENIEALRWFLDEVSPLADSVFTANDLVVVGNQPPNVIDEFASRGVHMLGFVEDLGAEYSRAAAAIVPLRLGAGVKFKTVEAILHRVPLVTTSVGAEGIPGLDSSSIVTDTPKDFAQRLMTILTSPQEAEAEAARLCEQVASEMTPVAFSERISRVLESGS